MPPASPAVARALAAEPVFDGHCDALQRQLDLGHDLGARTPGQFDLVRARAGGLGAVVLVCWVDPSTLPDGAAARAEALLAEAHALAARHPDAVQLVRTRADLAAARASGRIAGIPGIEGGHALEGGAPEARLERLERFFDAGVRVLTLVWNNHLDWIRSCQDGAGREVPDGLSDTGRRIVRRMGELGMVVDLSHAGERSFYDALEVAAAPPIASHSGCRALHDHPRNLSDDQLRALGRAGGVAGIVFHPGFLDADARAEEARVRATDAYRTAGAAEPDGFRGETARHLARSGVMQRDAAPLDLDRVCDHVLHACELAGPAHVGLGSDFDGIERGPRGLEDASGYPRLAERLLARGLGEDGLAGVLGGNLRRVFEATLPAGDEFD